MTETGGAGDYRPRSGDQAGIEFLADGARRRRSFRSAPLFAQIIGLVIVSLVGAQLITVAVFLLVPWPPPEAYRVSDLVKAFRQGGPLKVENARPLVVDYSNDPPPMGTPGRRRLEFRDTLAKALDVEPERVVVSIDGLRFIRSMRPPEGREGHGPPPGRAAFAGGPGAGLGPVPGGPSGPGGPGGSVIFRGGPDGRDDPLLFTPFKAAMRLDDGRWMVVHPDLMPRLNSMETRLLATLLITILAVSPLAWLLARRMTRPLVAFGGAAERLGRDPNAPPLELKGSPEVNAAVTAFNEMQDRLRRYVEHRTAMIGAIAHDLRTPLTRLRFRIEATPDEQRAKLAQDVEQMDAMISATLAFVRDANQTGERKPTELSSLVESVIDESAETGADAAVDQTDRVVVHGDPVALKRLLQNLVDNALKYGGQARGRVFSENGQAIVEIDDNGPGVPDADLDKVFEPFYRGEPSRNRQTGGIGLGLAVVRSIARGHGGDVSLLNRPRGGLTARVVLPAAP